MTISVLLSLYKAEKAENFERALLSIWDWQTLKPNQIVLIEDGPLTEELYETVDRWKKKLGDALCICKNEVNMGLTKSLNKGLQHATGNLIARMDSDDVSDPKRFEKQTQFLKENPDIHIVGGAMNEFSGDIVFNNGELQIIGKKENVRYYPEDKNIIKDYICKASPLCHGTVMMRAEMFKEGGIKYDERYRISQDIALWFDAVCAGYNISNLHDVIYHMEVGDICARRGRKKAYNEMKIYLNGIKRVHGFTYKYIYPLARCMFRLLPGRIRTAIYNSSARRKVLNA